MAKKFKINYLVVPDFVFNNERLTYMSAKVYSFIHNFRMEEFFYGNERLAELFGCSERSISRAITQLEEEGFITTRFDGRKRFIEDQFITHRLDKNVYPESPKLSSQSQAKASPTLSTLPQASTAEANKNNLIKKPMENFVDEKNFKDKNWLEAKKARSEKKKSGKGSGFGTRSRFPTKDRSPYRNDYQDNPPKKGGIDATDII